jgi:hypothetical protein
MTAMTRMSRSVNCSGVEEPRLRSPDEPDAVGAFSTREEAARQGLGARRAGWAQFGDEPEIITLDKPFMILDLRYFHEGVNILVADHVE